MENKTIINDDAHKSITSTIPNMLSGIRDAVSGKGKVIRFDYRYADTAKRLNTKMRKGMGNFTAEDIRRAVVKYATSSDRKCFPVSYRYGNVPDMSKCFATGSDDIIGIITRFTIRDELCRINVRLISTNMATMPLYSHPDEYGIGGFYFRANENSGELILRSLSIIPESELRYI